MHRHSPSRRARSFSPAVQHRKREFLSIETFTIVCRTETKRWLARDKFVLACHERPCGWRGGSPDRKIVGNMGAGRMETWLYIYYATYPYYAGYGPWDPYLGAPLYDPFYYSDIPPSIPYPGKVVTFANGRVVSFDYVAWHRSRIKNSVALCRATDKYSGGSNQWLIAHFDSSWTLWNKPAN
jgi:hypothetical protein